MIRRRERAGVPDSAFDEQGVVDGHAAGDGAEEGSLEQRVKGNRLDSQTHGQAKPGSPLMVASLMTFPEQGIVVSVTSNISYADTEAVALKIAQAFAEHASRPAGQ